MRADWVSMDAMRRIVNLAAARGIAFQACEGDPDYIFTLPIDARVEDASEALESLARKVIESGMRGMCLLPTPNSYRDPLSKVAASCSFDPIEMVLHVVVGLRWVNTEQIQVTP